MKRIIPIIVLSMLVLSGLQAYANDAGDITTSDETNCDPNPDAIYDLVIIAPKVFTNDLDPLVHHKNDTGINTTLVTTEDIYKEFDGVDKPEQIKYFIKDAIETWDIKYVLLVGGLNSVIYAKPRDNVNYGSKDWYVPVRYTNLYDDPAFPVTSKYSQIFYWNQTISANP